MYTFKGAESYIVVFVYRSSVITDNDPILIKCVKCYYLCVIRRLMRPILTLNCLLKIEQERSEEKSSVGIALALAFRCARFCL